MLAQIPKLLQLDGTEILPKSSVISGIVRNNVTDDRQTDRQTDGPCHKANV